jgi:hypothetical protein
MLKTKTILGAIAATLLSGSAVASTTPALTAPTPAEIGLRPSYGSINPFARDINAFWGNINPFWGDIGAFWGNINPFYGDIGAFWGNINPFYGDIGAFYGNINPFAGDVAAHYGNIGAFWGNINPFWGDINAFWGNITPFNASQYAQLATKLDELVTRSELFWGNAVRAKTGLSFRDGFANPLFAKYGINPADPASLAGKTAAQRSEFFLAWYDQLMDFSGMDHVDHWMKTINWTPAITQQQGEGYDAVIGLIDFTVAGDADIQSKLSFFSGVSSFSNGHGAGVASLMVAAHDGKGVMGIAPNATVVAYNPFDSTGTTSFADIKTGIVALSGKKASIINMSLGVPGWTLHKDWNTVFSDPAVAAMRNNTVFVVAAGNEGISQTTNIAWSWATDPNLIIVGSVRPDGVISDFSNRPGTACLLKDNGNCDPKDLLMNRFLVAPGELILVSDDKGGVVRQSGTSLAAPLVSGAIALLHDRWPWLVNFPKATLDIIFRSAKDLGAPGVDAVYGWGLLDVAAAQSVLDFSKLKFYENVNGVITQRNAEEVQRGGVKTSWEASGAYFVVFEDADKTQRDFAIPLSSRLTGLTVNGTGEQFQQFLYARLVDWINSGRSTKGFADTAGYLALSDSAVTLPAFDGLNVSFGFTTRADDLFATPSQEYALRIADENGLFGFNAGYGAGASTLGYQGTFALRSDYGVGGGVNPLLGFASGGGYGSVDLRLADDLRVSAGFSSSGDPLQIEQTYGESGLAPVVSDLSAYDAGAFTFALSYQLDRSVGLRMSYTQLTEANGLLGVRSLQSDDFAKGTVTDGLTIGADLALGDGFTLGLSGSIGQTRANQNDLGVIDPALSTAFNVALTKAGIFEEADRARFSLSQALHVESGTFSYTQVGVVDRLTGELGMITQEFAIGGQPREYNAEFLYAVPFADGDGEFGAFGKMTLRDDASTVEVSDFVVGASLGLKF